MESFKEQHQYISRLIEEQNYELAKWSMQQLMQVKPESPELVRTMGMLEVLTGYPAAAVARWKGLELADLRLSEEQFLEIKETLTTYQSMYETYNTSLQLIQTNKIQEARALLAPLMTEAALIPVPLKLYQVYYTLQAALGEGEKVLESVKQAPVYVNSSAEVIALVSRLQEHQYTADTVKLVRQKRVWSKLTYTAASIIVVLIALAGVLLIKDQDPAAPAAETVIAAAVEPTVEPAAGDSREELAVQKGLMQQLEAQNAELQNQLTDAKYNADKLHDMEKIVELTGNNIDDMVTQAAARSYRQGMDNYKDSNYERAVELLTESHSLGQQYYFSDDSLYYLIHSLKNSGQDELADQAYDSFLANTTEPFLQSPYRDDVMLEKAESFIAADDMERAQPLLKQIIEQYSDQWTADKARQINK